MELVSDTLSRFAGDTRCPPRRVESAEGREELARRLLALHIRELPWRSVYAHVATDADRLALRVGGPAELNAYADAIHVAPAVYATLVAGCEPPTRVPEGAFTHFRDTVLPEKDAHLVGRQSKGRDLAYYVAALGARDRPHFRDALRAIAAAGRWDETQQPLDEELYGRMMAYRFPSQDAEVAAAARELGEMLVETRFPVLSVTPVDAEQPQKAPEEPSAEAFSPPQHQVTIVLAPAPPAKRWDAALEAALRAHEALAEYKRRAGLSRQFPAQKALKQLVVLATSPKGAAFERDSVRSILGRRQRSLFNGELPEVSAADWASLLAALDHTTVPTSIGELPSVRRFYSTLQGALPVDVLKKWDSRALLRALLTAHVCGDWAEKWASLPNHEEPAPLLRRIVGVYRDDVPQLPDEVRQVLIRL